MHTERKSGRFYAASIFAGVLLISALSACIQSLGSNDGMAQIVIGEPSRQAIAPQWNSADIVSYTLYGKITTDTSYTELLSFSPTAVNPSLYIAVDTWDFQLVAKDSNSFPFLSGTIIEKTLSAETTTTLSFTLQEMTSGTGTAAISVVLPSGHQAASYLVRLDPGPTESPEPTAIPAAPSGEPTTVSFNQGLAAGEYDIAFEFFNAAGTLILSVGERLWIRDNLTSSHTFNPALTEFGSAPLAPTNFTASYIPGSGGVVRVNWTDNSNNETGFEIDGLDPENVITRPAGSQSYIYSGLNYGQELTITIRAVNAFGDSGIETKTLQLPWLVSFDSNGGSMLRPVEVYHGLQLSAPTPPTKADHSFAGWYHDAALTNEFDFSNETITADRTLYAKWITDTVYVSSTGDDTSGDGSKALPFATITKALAVLETNSVPQGTVRIAEGSYDELFTTLSIPSGRRLEGGWNTDFTLRSYQSPDGYGVGSSMYTSIKVPLSFTGTAGLGSSLSGLEISAGEISPPEYLVQIASECMDPISIEWCTINLSGTGSTTAVRTIYAQASVPLQIANCNISVGTYTEGAYAIDSTASQTWLSNNKITTNGGTYAAWAVNVSAGTLLANSNYIQNQSSPSGNALRIAGVSKAAVFNNYIESDYATTVSYSANDAEPLLLFNNVIKTSSSSTDAIALNASTASFSALIANNIIIANTSAGNAINFTNPDVSTNTNILHNDISGFATLLSINGTSTVTDIETLNGITTQLTASGNTSVFVEANSFDTNSPLLVPVLRTTAPLGLRNGGLDLSVSGDLNSLSMEIQTLAVKDAFGSYRSGDGAMGWSMGLHEQDWRNADNTVSKAGPTYNFNESLIDHSAGSIIRHEIQGTDLTNRTYYLTTGAVQVKGNGTNLPLYSTFTDVYTLSGNFTIPWTIDLTNELGETKTYTFTVLADGFTYSNATWYTGPNAWFANGSSQLEAPTIGRGQTSSVERVFFDGFGYFQYISFDRELSASTIAHLKVEVFMGGSSTDSLAAWGIDTSQRLWTGTVASASNNIDLSGKSVTYPVIVRFTWYKDDEEETIVGEDTAYLQNIMIQFTSESGSGG